ncbi:MAG: dihydrolipoyl dehydrogenase [Candidatus Marinimicrobia bacterium]|jgi:dihydrolipoamide dehydrogenase|nr:dihydrolipoyl dehydrogenase [Candidatus Neomarinimicrobiota bacterium]MBT3630110.1 dihydrolipoyl dehydrogenase [Candidatus Neomarinimicrobiota bacterium]MBT3826062.1 dihydrolipoyl dehydrogenase [Candidatus Neomarinimicrobiota bacterium]MBT4132096.1 dihydrolipoyl dehydrogenase [Candidatus Neomarinimicrobiota bacterium]MBT4296583.1 dihydrolipoyl dehydrogenase [Candidatus Neomarinimicrobiota bacterium]
MNSTHYDIAIIGGGPGGYVAAIRAAQLGKKAVVVERSELGGICLNWGCIPTKALLKSAEVLRSAQKAKKFGVMVSDVDVDFTSVIKRSRQVAGSLSKGVAFLMKKNEIDVINGSARLLGSNQISINEDQQISADQIIVATGARPRPMPGAAYDGETIISSKEAMNLENIPEKLVVVGAGAIGIEFADFYAAMGSQVTIVEMLPHLLPIEDEEVSVELEKMFKRKKIKAHTESMVKSISVNAGRALVKVKTKSDDILELDADKVLIAIGVQGNIEALGLEEAGVQLEKGWIKTNAYMQTSAAGIYAIGDVAGPPWLAHVASHEGITAVEHIAGLNVKPMHYDNVPGCTYCTPQVASIGLTERAAREAGYEVKIGKFPYRVSGKAMAAGETDGFTKLIYDAKFGELLGAHIIGAEATELIAEIGIARSLEATHEAILETIHAHPTLSEMIMEASGLALDRGIHL